MTKPKFFVEFTRESWECGDGCCSDSWHDIRVYKDGELVSSHEECRWVYNEEDARNWATDEIESSFELEKDSYDLEIDY